MLYLRQETTNNIMMSTTRRSVAIAVFLIALTPTALAAAPQTNDLTAQFRAAGANVDRLQVSEISGIVIIRGRVADKVEAEALSRYATSLGYARVANLIQINPNNDAEMTRAAERELTMHRSLDGCRFQVSAEKGVIRVAGSVQHELQKDVASQVLRSIDGVKSVEMKLDRF
jgi:osmotically-inducible protein OsmY